MTTRVYRRGRNWRVTGAVGLLICTGAWLATMWWSLHFRPGRGMKLALTMGGVHVVLRCPNEQRKPGDWRLTISRNGAGAGIVWRLQSRVNPHGASALGTDRHVFVPLWVPGALLGGILILGIWRGYGLRAGRCPACGYDLAGLPEPAACPECGRGRQITAR